MSSTTHLDLPQDLKTRDLLGYASRGDDRAWEVLYRRYRVHLLLSARSHLKDRLRGRVDEEDIVQSAFLSAWDRIRSFEYRGENSFRLWLSRIVVNNVFDKLRAARNEVGKREDSGTLRRAEAQGDPSSLVAKAEEQMLILEQLAELPDEQRDVIVLRKFEQKPWAEVGEILGCTDDAARRKFRIALAVLTKSLAKRQSG